MDTLIAFVHIAALGCWVGSIVFFSFFTAPAVFGQLEREKAGELIGVIFPRYYRIGYVCGALLLATLIAARAEWFGARMLVLAAMLACSLYAGLVVRPRAAELKARMKSVADEASRVPLEAKFKSVHALSVRLNAATLLGGLVMLWLTAGRLSL